MNDCFQENFVTDNGEDVTPVNHSHNCQMENFVITEEDILQALKKVPCKLSRTPENVPSYVIKKIGPAIVRPLLVIFNNSLYTSIIPNAWKQSIVIPVHKKGSRKDPKNHRPIHLTSGFSRLYELIVHDKTTAYLIDNSLLSKSQYGFLPGRSSCSQLLNCTYDWLWSYLNKETVDVIYLDIAKAFDSVSHEKLIVVLQSYGINNELINWFKEFLKLRYQRVCIGNYMSSPIHVKSGVPQGGVIAPLVFVVYLDGMIKDVEAKTQDVKMMLFADDSKLYSNNPVELQTALNTSISWTENRQLKVAPHKCHQLQLSKLKPENVIPITIDNMNLEIRSTICDLGIVVAENLKWSDHCNLIYRRASQISYQIMKCFKTKNIWVLMHLYTTYVRPKVENNSQVWSPYLAKDIIRIESIQRSFTRFAFLKCGIPFTSYTDRLTKINFKTLQERRIILDLVLLFKIINRLSDINFSEYFIFTTSTYNLRRNSLQIRPLKNHISDQWKNFYFIRASRIWSSLPKEIVRVPNLSLFKRKMNDFDLSNFLL